MRALLGFGDQRPSLSAVSLLGAVSALMLASLLHPSAAFFIVVPLALILPIMYAYEWFFAWRQQLAVLILVILFIPIQRYAMAGGLPFQLEPYRILVALMLAGWVMSLLIDERVTFRRSGFEEPIVLIAVASLFSELANSQRIATLDVQPEVIKGLMFLGSFFLIFYLVVSVVRTRADVERVLEVLCAGGGVLGIFAVIEYRTHYDAFDHLQRLMPFLTRLWPDGPGLSRGGDVRVIASAQHPIALGALFVILVPLSVYLAMRPGKRIWWVAAFAVMIGALASVSRTSIVMLAAVGLVFLWQRPRQTLKAWPLIVPAVLAIQLAVPGALRNVESSFFPQGGLVAQQSANGDQNRLSRWGPTLKEWRRDPLVGEGFSTRQPQMHPETTVLDDQWLKSLVETGILGVLGWLWLFGRSIGRLSREAREDERGGWLELALAAGVTSFAVGMAFYDAFSFIQVTVILFILLALDASLGLARESESEATARGASAATVGSGESS
ncbi:MAG TPA: O-antigen ligase family protein [Gaiellaceae bacterium]|nr:O-antigen ligase family protein [Gaiellaceae bacterium]